MRLAPSEALSDRLRRLRVTLRESAADAVLVTHLPNLAYITNLFASAGAALVTRDTVAIVADGRYSEALRALLESPHACPGARQVAVAATYDETIARLIAESGVARLAVEAESLTIGRFRWFEYELKRLAASVEIVPIDRLIIRHRIVKDAHEISLFRTAARLLSAAAASVLGEVRVGRTEREVAARIDFALKTAGFERPAFDTIVAAGERSAQPHARPTDRVIGADELVVLDFGGVYGGYCVDLTRTVFTGVPIPTVVRVFDAVRSAHEAAIREIRPGVRAWDVDQAARRTLMDHGLADVFTHGTGHGLGLEIHEEPRIVQKRPDAGPGSAGSDRLERGMVFTIEPGAYLSGWGGVRIEDDVLVTDSGVDVLTDVPVTLTWPPARQ